MRAARFNRSAVLARAALAAVLAAAMVLGVAQARQRGSSQPTVVELFTSQGCSSCPPANENLAALGDRPDVLALSFGVTYWDQLGWKDTFAHPAFTNRQRTYARALGHNPFTPEVVVDGRSYIVGNVKGSIEAEIRKARRPDGPALSLDAGSLRVGAGRAVQAADVWLVRYDPRIVQVPIRRGENGGRTLPHRYVVRELHNLGTWSGAPARYRLQPAENEGLRTAVIVQTRNGGPILASLKV